MCRVLSATVLIFWMVGSGLALPASRLAYKAKMILQPKVFVRLNMRNEYRALYLDLELER